MMNNLYLVHHGILGQKWGVRRYQNKDGTLTEAGKERLSKWKERENEKVVKRAEKEAKSAIKDLNQYKKESQASAAIGDARNAFVAEKMAELQMLRLRNIASTAATEAKAIASAHLGDIKDERVAVGKRIVGGLLVGTAGAAAIGGLSAAAIVGAIPAGMAMIGSYIPALVTALGIATAAEADTVVRRKKRVERAGSSDGS